MGKRFRSLNRFESFRDPLGKVVLDDTDVWRLVDARENGAFGDLIRSDVFTKWQRSGKVVSTRAADQSERDDFTHRFADTSSNTPKFDLYKHERVWFPSFPYEWSPQMLYDAAEMTLEIAGSFFARTGWSIKDASPFNVLFRGSEPIFIDILSFEKRDPHDPIWVPYNQFVQTFLLPLLVNKELGLPMQSIFFTYRDGLPVTEAAKLFGPLKKLKPGILSLVTLPNLLSKKAEGDASLYKPKSLDSAEKAEFILEQSFKRLNKQLAKVAPAGHRESKWTDYTKFNQETIPDYMAAKQAFVVKALEEQAPKHVLDIGCNTGFFSFLAARSGASVVALDHDEAVVSEVYKTARKQKLNLLPLVVNISRPTPRMGWRYSENPSFLDRALGRFDLVMMLAVVHHMLVQERIPLREIMRLAADLTTESLIVEFVPPDDKMFRRLTRGRDHLHKDLTTEKFTEISSEFFQIVRSEKLPDTKREIFLMTKK